VSCTLEDGVSCAFTRAGWCLVLLTAHPRFGLRRPHRRESSPPPPQGVRPATATTRHTRLIARHESLRPKSPGLARLEHESRSGLHRSPPPDSPESASNRDHAPRRTRAAGTLAARSRVVSDAIDVEDPALLAVSRGVNREIGQDASPLNQQTTDAIRHPMNFDESLDPFSPSGLSALWFRLFRVDCARWRPRRSSRPFPTIHGGCERRAARSSSRAVSRSSMASS
jgi:hypothetical protein